MEEQMARRIRTLGASLTEPKMELASRREEEEGGGTGAVKGEGWYGVPLPRGGPR